MLKCKLTKKFEEMSFKEKAKEVLKMYLFVDTIIAEYHTDMGFYMTTHKRFDVDSNSRIKMDMRVLRSKLVEAQKLLAKYNYEDEIMGYEIIEVDSQEYSDVIKPYKIDVDNKKTRLFNRFFKSSVA